MHVRLIAAKTRTVAEAEMVAMTTQHIQQARTAWEEEFRKRQRLLISDEDVMVWRQGVMSGTSTSADRSRMGYVIIFERAVQGVVAYDDELQQSRRRPGTLLLYVSYLASAPWNRRHGDQERRFRNVGRMLVAQSVRESITLGCPGRIGLHSYPSAHQFYENLGFDKLGPDASRRGMTYFELRPGAAFQLLSDFGAPERSLQQSWTET